MTIFSNPELLIAYQAGLNAAMSGLGLTGNNRPRNQNVTQAESSGFGIQAPQQAQQARAGLEGGLATTVKRRRGPNKATNSRSRSNGAETHSAQS